MTTRRRKPSAPADDTATRLDAATEHRLDSIVNAISGLGTSDDRATATQVDTSRTRLTDAELEALFEFDDMSGRVVSKLPEECIRRGWRVVASTGGDDPFRAEFERLRLAGQIAEAHQWARLFGGGALVLDIDDGRDVDQPVDMASIRGIRAIEAVDRTEITPEGPVRRPTAYYLATDAISFGSGSVARLHPDRVIPLIGRPTSRRRSAMYSGWGVSVLDAVWDALSRFRTVEAGTASLVHEFEFGVMSVKNLASIVAGGGAGGSAKLMQRMIALKLGKSIARMIVLDADGEAYQRSTSAAASGLGDVWDRFAASLCAAAEMPATMLFGQPPKGFATDDAAGRTYWYDRVAATQERIYRPIILRICELLVAARAVDLPPDATWKLEFLPLLSPTEDQLWTARLKQLQAYRQLWEIGAADEAEIRDGVLGPAGWGADIRAMSAEQRAAADMPDNPQGGGNATA